MLIPLSKGKFAIVDSEDYEYLMRWKWYTSYYGYAVASDKGKKILMHRVIMNTPKHLVTDHIDHNTLDNRKSNLRICTKRQNQLNVSLRKDNTSGAKGVRRHQNKWNVRVYDNGKEINIGSYADKTEAISAYNEAALKYYGAFAKLNKVLT